MDPSGILMLRSVRIVFEIIGVSPESIHFIKEEFDADNLVKALTIQPKKCPAIITFGNDSPHVMVASNAIKGSEFIQEEAGELDKRLKNQWFITCKNSYRDDVSEPGIAAN